MNLFHIEGQLLEQTGENLLIVNNPLSSRFVKINPNFNAVATRIVDLACDKSKSVDFIAQLEIFSQKEEGQILVNLLFVCLGFVDLENKAASSLVLLIFPFWLDPLPEKFDGVDFFLSFVDLVTA